MPQEETRLKSPVLQELTPLINKIDQSISDGAWPLRKEAKPDELCEEDIVSLQETLEWVRTFLANRKDYHKKRQLTQKAEIEELRKALKGKGYDLDAIKRQAAANVADRIVDETADES